jgi:hypothetical protein
MSDGYRLRASHIKAARLREGVYSMARMRRAVTVPREDTDAMRLGRAIHAAVLLPDPTPWPIWEGVRRAGAAWESFAAECGGDYLRVEEVAHVEAVTDADIHASTFP